VSPTCSTTTLFRLWYRIHRGTPPSVSNASAWPRRKVSRVWSSVNRAYIARDHDSTSTKHDSDRVAAPTWILPKCPQSTCACSPGKVDSLRNASALAAGRTTPT
jgi:hypothetical protein